ncbi:MAG: hypothetical protein A2259_01100 [Candidatus Moranbacteria bacterium RIFOXYA2_FULL_43_15]|nr:MAG: hypothetical protein A2259_01100 [Candidatus Moranbacteria bacterium RIFOXYA2_FULL_43_15]
MHWLAIAGVAYLLIALEVILDKFLLSSRRVSHPAIYAFYSGVLSLFAFIFFPFGFHWIPSGRIAVSLLAGMIFVYGILSLFFAIRKSEASRVTPVVGATIPVVTYFLSIFFLEESLGMAELSGVAMLILGGIWISLDISKGADRRFFKGFLPSILAGVLLGSAFTLFKSFYESDKFINVYIWTRFGVMLGALSLLANPGWRRLIVGSLFNFKKPSSENKKSGAIFVMTKCLGGVGSILKEYATSIGSVTIVGALVSLEYVFIFVFGIALSFWLPAVFQEKRGAGNIFQKISAIAIITVGVVLVSRYG